MEVVSRALILGAFSWSENAIKTVVMRAGPIQGTYFWSVGDGIDLLVLGALGWSGNALKTVVMCAGPLQGT